MCAVALADGFCFYIIFQFLLRFFKCDNHFEHLIAIYHFFSAFFVEHFLLSDFFQRFFLNLQARCYIYSISRHHNVSKRQAGASERVRKARRNDRDLSKNFQDFVNYYFREKKFSILDFLNYFFTIPGFFGLMLVF